MIHTFRQKIPTPIKHRIWFTHLFIRSLSSHWRMEPSFIIIGTQKGGTTSLYYYLTQHPQVMPALEKEIRFWDHNYHKGLNWYKAHFPLKLWGRQKITGEASPNYMYDPRPPLRLLENLPKTKFIVLLRNPIDRAFSSYQMSVRRGKETLSFSDAIDIEYNRLENETKAIQQEDILGGKKRQWFSYLSRGQYSVQLKIWLHLFPPEQFLFINTESFFTHTRTIWVQVLRFLSLNEFSPTQFNIHNFGGKYEKISGKVRNQLDK